MRHYKPGDRVRWYLKNYVGQGRVLSQFGIGTYPDEQGREHFAYNVEWEGSNGPSPVCGWALVPVEPLTPFQQSVQDYIQAELG